MWKHHALFYLGLILISCGNSKRAMPESSFVSKGGYNLEGNESGRWKIIDSSNNQVVEEGNFVDGVRVGQWLYYVQPKDTITWLPFIDSSASIRTNIPDFLVKLEDGDGLIKFKHIDSRNLFTLVIGNGFTTLTTLKEYQKMIFADLSSRGALILDSSTNFVETSSKRQYLFSHIAGNLNENFSLFNIVSEIQGKLVEVSLRCSNQNNELARKVFFSVISNLFINSERFIYRTDIITGLGKGAN